MRPDIKDINPNTGTIFFIILFVVFTLIYSDKSESQTLPPSGYSLQNELIPGNGSLHFDATMAEAVSLTDLYKNCKNFSKCASFMVVSSPYLIVGYNQLVTRKFADIQKTTLAIEPLFLFRLSYHLSLSEKEDLPFLS